MSEITSDESGSNAESDSGSESDDQPAANVRALKETLADRGMTVEIESDGQTISVAKLGESYRLQPGEVINGDGRYRRNLNKSLSKYSG